MAHTRDSTAPGYRTGTPADRRRGWFAAGGMLGAVLASSCCIVPLLLLSLGVSGAWIGNLTALSPYKPWFAGAALVFIVLGFRHVHQPKDVACAPDGYCAKPGSTLVVKWALWAATLLVLSAVTVQWWAPLLYQS